MPPKQTKAKPAASKARQPRPKRITASRANIKRALEELGINRPYYRARVVGGRLELCLYGGDVVFWPAAASPEADSKEPRSESSKEET